MGSFDELGFTRDWIDLGIITPDKLSEIEIEWAKGDDPNTEHFRWRAFRDFLSSRESFTDHELIKLYELGASDQDPIMGGSMMVDILHRKDCPTALLIRASTSQQKFLRRVACERLGKEFGSN